MVTSIDDSIPTRQSLLERMKDSDDHQSWNDFFQTYKRLIYNVATKAGLTDSEAQEAVQETVISVSRKIAEYKTDAKYGSFKGWLLRITQRRIVDQFRKRRPGQIPLRGHSDATQTATAERIADPASLDLNAVWEEQWQKNLFEVALDRVKQRVSPKKYLLFYQLVVKEWPPRKVAETYRVTLAHVYVARYQVANLIKKEVKRLERQSECLGQ